MPKGDCKPCACNLLGTIPAADGGYVCEQPTGQCPCKDNVIGRQCNVCKDGFFDLASGAGCQECMCDPVGALNATCDVRSGQCFCRDGVVGLRYAICNMPCHALLICYYLIIQGEFIIIDAMTVLQTIMDFQLTAVYLVIVTQLGLCHSNATLMDNVRYQNVFLFIFSNNRAVAVTYAYILHMIIVPRKRGRKSM